MAIDDENNDGSDSLKQAFRATTSVLHKVNKEAKATRKAAEQLTDMEKALKAQGHSDFVVQQKAIAGAIGDLALTNRGVAFGAAQNIGMLTSNLRDIVARDIRDVLTGVHQARTDAGHTQNTLVSRLFGASKYREDDRAKVTLVRDVDAKPVLENIEQNTGPLKEWQAIAETGNEEATKQTGHLETIEQNTAASPEAQKQTGFLDAIEKNTGRATLTAQEAADIFRKHGNDLSKMGEHLAAALDAKKQTGDKLLEAIEKNTSSVAETVKDIKSDEDAAKERAAEGAEDSKILNQTGGKAGAAAGGAGSGDPKDPVGHAASSLLGGVLEGVEGAIGGLGIVGIAKAAVSKIPLAARMAGIVGSILWAAFDGIVGYESAEKWGVDKIDGVIGGIIAGQEGGLLNAAAQAGKYALAGATIGALGGPVGIIAGTLIGAALGGVLGWIGGDTIARGFHRAKTEIEKWADEILGTHFSQSVADLTKKLDSEKGASEEHKKKLAEIDSQISALDAQIAEARQKGDEYTADRLTQQKKLAQARRDAEKEALDSAQEQIKITLEDIEKSKSADENRGKWSKFWDDLNQKVIVGPLTWLGDRLKEGIDSFSKGVSEGWKAVTDGATAKFGEAREALSGLLDRLTEWLKNIFSWDYWMGSEEDRKKREEKIQSNVKKGRSQSELSAQLMTTSNGNIKLIEDAQQFAHGKMTAEDLKKDYEQEAKKDPSLSAGIAAINAYIESQKTQEAPAAKVSQLDIAEDRQNRATARDLSGLSPIGDTGFARTSVTEAPALPTTRMAEANAFQDQLTAQHHAAQSRGGGSITSVDASSTVVNNNTGVVITPSPRNEEPSYMAGIMGSRAAAFAY